MRMREIARAGTRAAPLLALSLSVAGCDAPPVDWQELARQPSAAIGTGDGAASGAAEGAAAPRLTLDDAGRAALVAPLTVASPPDSAGLRVCHGSVRVAAGKGGERAAAWWAARPDSSVVLLAALSTDGGASWAPAVPVDTLDRGVRGCARPAPAIAADSVNGWVHTVYFLEAPEGAGIFYAHRMDPRAPFEPPGVIVYGDRPAAAAVASLGDTLVVAYEDPNRERPQVELALSRSGGHVFDERHLDVSGSDVAARDPSAAVGPGGHVAVAWDEGGRRVVRIGRLR
ncbi:MAG: hypothetical protein ACJ79S_16270 [Gemmatimonadaceae bacterium]